MYDDDLRIVNIYREDKTYSDEAVAPGRKGNALKKKLIFSPFVIKFEYGSNGEGYWNYDAMSIQFKDCIDCIKSLHLFYDCIYLFNHSCGHNRKRPNGLNINILSKGHGGKQPKMRKSMIKHVEGISVYIRTR